MINVAKPCGQEAFTVSYLIIRDYALDLYEMIVDERSYLEGVNFALLPILQLNNICSFLTVIQPVFTKPKLYTTKTMCLHPRYKVSYLVLHLKFT